MIKLDPHYMNRVIIEKIREQNKTWQKSALSGQFISKTRPKSASGRANMRVSTVMSRKTDGTHTIEFRTGLQEMMDLEKAMRATPKPTVHTTTLS